MAKSRLPFLLLLAALAVGGSAVAQTRPLSDYKKVLVPVYVRPGQAIRGAFGSNWQTTLMLRNDGDTVLDVFPMSQTCASSSVCNQTMGGGIAPRSNRTVGNIPPLQFATFGAGGLNGGFLYVQADRLRQLTTHLTFEDLSRTPAAVVSLPLVPEDDFFDATRSIVGVPISAVSRATLRVYDDGTSAGAAMIVRIYLNTFEPGPAGDPFRFDRPLVEQELSFASQQNDCGFLFGCPAVQYKPNVLILSDLLGRFPALEAAADVRDGVRIELEPRSPLVRFWPLVTVTVNDTSHTTAYTVR
jgi:hypothetical protein